MRELKLGKDFLVTVHNDLVEARFTDSLAINEQKILFAVLSNIEPPEFDKDEKGKRFILNKIEEIEPFRVPIKEFTHWLGLSDPNYAAFKKLIKSLMKKLIEIQQPDGSWEVFQWVTKSSYVAKTGTAEIKLSPELYPYLINLENNFTTTKLNVILSFKSRYSTRLYQLMKKWEKIGSWKVELEELKMLLGIPVISENKGVKLFKLDKYSHFKDRALMTAISEINEHSEFDVTMTEHKSVRKVTAISFNIKSKGKQKASPKPPEATSESNGNENGQTGDEGNEAPRFYGKDLLDRYNYRENSGEPGLYNKENDKLVLLEGLKRVQLIIYNRKRKNNFSEKACYLLEKELLKVEHKSDFDISRETHFIFSYAYNSKGLTNPEGFIVSRTKELVSRLLKGEKARYKDLFDTRNHRIELLPEWWFASEKSRNQEQKEQQELEEKARENRLLPDSTLTMTQVRAIQLKLELSPDMNRDELLKFYNYEEYQRLDELYGIDQLVESKEQELKGEKVAI